MEQIISIIIPNSNDKTYLLRCLNSIRRQTYENTEVILVTDIDDKICSDAKEQFSELHILQISEKTKYAGLNQAIQNAQGKYIMFCNIQSVMAPNTLDLLLKDAESNPDTFTIGRFYIPSGKDFTACENMELFFYGKLFQKNLIYSNNVQLSENFPLAEFLFLSQYLKSFQTIQINDETFIYETDADTLQAEYSADSSICYWDLLFASLADLAMPLRTTMLESLNTYIKEHKINSFKVLFSAERNAHTLYGLNYALSESLLHQVWTDITYKSKTENLVSFREYLKCYEKDDEYFQLLLSTCGLTKSIYAFLWKDPIDLLLLKETCRNSVGEVVSKNDFYQLHDDISNVKHAISDLQEIVEQTKAEEINAIQKHREFTGNNQIHHILQVEDFITTECREGRVGLKTIWKFGKACMGYKMKGNKK